ncbi:glycosyltransferase family 39 protein [Candidatus Sumerlaeota bacterium]|nr:glycosyltransferase family 39 protein [Candidatus Sumerlaeota bacterium]
MTMTDPIMYQLYIGAIAKLAAGDAKLIIFYTIILCLLMPWAWYKFFRELQTSKPAALAGAAVIIWLPSWLCIYSYYMQETLMLPLLGVALWMTWRCKRKQTVESFVTMVALWAIAGLTRGACIPMAATAAIGLWLAQPEKWKKAAYSILLLGSILIPLSIRSYQQIGLVSPHGVGQLNMIYAMSGKKEVKINYKRHQGNQVWYFGFMSPVLLIDPLEPLIDWHTQRKDKVVVDIDIDKGKEGWKKSLEENKLTLEKYRWITKENLIFLFFSASWPDSNDADVLSALNYHLRWIWAPLGVYVLICSILSWRALKKRLLLPAIILSWFIVQGLLPISVNEGRYRKPFEGLLIAQMVLLAGALSNNRRKNEENVSPALSNADETTDAAETSGGAAGLS